MWQQRESADSGLLSAKFKDLQQVRKGKGALRREDFGNSHVKKDFGFFLKLWYSNTDNDGTTEKGGEFICILKVMKCNW